MANIRFLDPATLVVDVGSEIDLELCNRRLSFQALKVDARHGRTIHPVWDGTRARLENLLPEMTRLRIRVGSLELFNGEYDLTPGEVREVEAPLERLYEVKLIAERRGNPERRSVQLEDGRSVGSISIWAGEGKTLLLPAGRHELRNRSGSSVTTILVPQQSEVIVGEKQ